jgi:cytochrome c oxidase subunit 2
MNRILARSGGIAVLGLLPAGCSDVQSVLAPVGPDAARIWQLGVWMTIGAVVVLAIVCAATWIALRGSEAARRKLAGDGAIIGWGIVFPAVTLTVLLVCGVWVMRASMAPAAATAPQLRIEVSGELWWWRIAYLDPQGNRIPGANEIRLPVGREVEFILTSPDVIHSFWIPNLSGKLDMIPGRTNRLRVRADHPGVYRGQCAEYCGGAHARMALEVVALPEAAFDAWLATAARPAAEPSAPQAQHGRDLLLTAGCGSCHTVRGTPANGVIGPDLTLLGERRMIAAATLPTTPMHLAHFIENSQELKPGNRMPPFRIFKPDELEAVAIYLAGLK